MEMREDEVPTASTSLLTNIDQGGPLSSSEQVQRRSGPEILLQNEEHET